VERGTRIFWALIAILLGSALYFGSNAEARRRAVHKTTGTLATGDVVQLDRVIDGDSLVVTNPGGEKVSVRILGIKTFEPKPARDPAARFGKAAMEEIERTAREQPIRVMLHTTPEDKYGRAIATLFVGDKDLGLALVKKGLALVYTTHPFPSMPLYLTEQETAQAKQQGLWADAEIARRAELLAREWQRESQ
jgi:endonuclease YncB( thermonuclease family)